MKRFYKTVSIRKKEGGFGLELDGRAIKTPAKKDLLVPSKALAEAMKVEWEVQKDKIDPHSMPVNRLANTAIDRTSEKLDMVVDEIMGYARFDQLCFRADVPEDLIEIEAKAWDPYLTWAAETLGAEFKAATGINTEEQAPEALLAIKTRLKSFDPFILTAIHNATTLTGSVILTLALEAGFKRSEQIWQDAHVDEDYQVKKWGEDTEAAKIRAEKHTLWRAIATYLKALK